MPNIHHDIMACSYTTTSIKIPIIAQALNGDLQCIAKGIYLTTPSTNSASLSSSDLKVQPPNLILTFGWAGAKLTHLLKYTKFHHDIYPKATNILIKCEYSFFISRETTRQRNLEPVIEVLQALGYLPSASKSTKITRPRLLIHAFSNGGGSQLTCFSRLLKARFPEWDIFKPSTCAIVFDSCPGLGDVKHARNAMSGLVRSPMLRPFLNALIAWLFFYAAVKKWLFGLKNPLEILKIDLNRPNILPWTRESTPRLYLCSKKDEVVAFHEVEEHANEGKAAGFDVKVEVFEDTPHVSHAKLEPKRYWGAVEAIWAAAANSQEAA